MNAAHLPDLDSYDRFLVAFSGGKDCLAALLRLLELGVPRDRIELHHHDVDGGGAFMDWTVTPAYCQAVADHLGLRLYFSGKVGGLEREMMRDGTATAPIYFDTPEGVRRTVGGKGPPGTRRKFPQVAANLAQRWCSAYLKIDVMDALIRNQERFLTGRTLVITGERAQESPARAKYATFEPHRADTRHGAQKVRHIDHWRPVHTWHEGRVWEIIRRWKITPHVAYLLGWARLSCLSCIFGSPNQWATIRAVFREHFERIATREEALGVTIQRRQNVRELADRGTPYPAALANPELVAMAKGTAWTLPIQTADWSLPAGAYGEDAGPT